MHIMVPEMILFISNSKIRRILELDNERITLKKLICKLLIFIAIISLAVVPVSIIIDPYNVFHTYEPRDNGIESNKSFIKTEYIKKNHDEFDGLVFGSSRAGFMDIGYLNEVSGMKFYDMASSESVVKEQAMQLEVLIKAGFIPKEVIVMVDDISCFVDPAIHENMLYRKPYPADGIIDRLEFYVKYLDVITNVKSLNVIKEKRQKDEVNALNNVDDSYDNSTNMSYLDRFYHTGTERLDKDSRFDPDEPQYQKGYWVDYYSFRGDEAIEDMKCFADICNKNGIKLIVMTNPLYYLTHEKAVEEGYLDYLGKLSEVTDYYNFSCLSSITEDYTYYYETSHFMPEVTRMMIDCVYGKTHGDMTTYDYEELRSQGFGVVVTKDNADDVMNLLAGQVK